MLGFLLFPSLLLFLNQIELLQLFIAIFVLLHVVIKSLILNVRRLTPPHIRRSTFPTRHSNYPNIRAPPLSAALLALSQPRRMGLLFLNRLSLLVTNILQIDTIEFLLLHRLLLVQKLRYCLAIFVV